MVGVIMETNFVNEVATIFLMSMKAKVVILFAFFIIHSCYNVDLDYYTDDNEDGSHNETDDLEETRRIGSEPKAAVNNFRAKITTDTSLVENTTETDSTSNDEPTDIPEYDYYYYQDNVSQLPLNNIFDDYQYAYADDSYMISDTTDNSDDLETTTSTEQNFTNVNASKSLLNQRHPSGKPRITDLFHVIPAVRKIKITKSPQKLNKLYAESDGDENVWYVPEEYPCWELPILFGRFKSRAKIADVFVLKGGTLDGISIDSGSDLPYTRRNSNNDPGNKWCEEGPCYGDHTLCTFSNDSISRICDTTYKVNKLTVYEQLVVLNTINAMRHRVAMGTADVYIHLPTAANMQQVMYDVDLAKISNRWLRQCLPGPAACSSLDDVLVTQLECKKCLASCCMRTKDKNCSPRDECFVSEIVGCLHAWFLSAGEKLQKRDVDCGYITRDTFNTAQILWANTDKIGCAYGVRGNGDTRFVCNFSPGATFYLRTKFYCGIIPHKDETAHYQEVSKYDVTSLEFMEKLGIQMNATNLSTPQHWRKSAISQYVIQPHTPWGVSFLRNKVNRKLRIYEGNYKNGTIGAVARLVTRYSFFEQSHAKCDSGESMYQSGPTGSECVETGRVFTALCYSYRDPYPGYRLAAIIAPVALFALILYDLFSGVLRQSNY